MDIKIYIYSLSDPETGEVRYVGKTVQDPYHRYHSHISCSKHSRKKDHCHCWIKSLINKGQKPIMKIVEETHDINREIFWINEYKKSKHNLTNHTDGGDQGTLGTTWKLSEGSKKNISEGHKKKFYYVYDRCTGEFLFKINRIDFIRKYGNINKKTNPHTTKDFILSNYLTENIEHLIRNKFYVFNEDGIIEHEFSKISDIKSKFNLDHCKFYYWTVNKYWTNINGKYLKITKDINKIKPRCHDHVPAI